MEEKKKRGRPPLPPELRAKKSLEYLPRKREDMPLRRNIERRTQKKSENYGLNNVKEKRRQYFNLGFEYRLKIG